MRSSVIPGVVVMSGQALPSTKLDSSSSRWWTVALIVSGILLVAIFLVATRRSKPVEETVTVSRNPQHQATVGRPVATGNPVQVGDRELESIGDRIAQAAVLLSQRQRNAALRAISSAQTAVRQLRALRPDLDEQLKSAEAELAAIEREVQRGNVESARSRLLQLGRTIDTVNQS